MIGQECDLFRQMMDEIHTQLEIEVIDPTTRQKVGASDDLDVIYEQIENFDIAWVKPAMRFEGRPRRSIDQYWPKMVAAAGRKEARAGSHEARR